MSLITLQDPRAPAAIAITMIDDDPEEFFITSRVLEKARTPFIFNHIKPTAATNINAELTSSRCDIILLDHHLGTTNGLHILQQLSPSNRPSIVVLTDDDDVDLIDNYLELGAEHFMRKSELSADLIERTLLFLTFRHGLLAEMKGNQEASLRRERLTTLGALAAGAAHEYNNLSAVIMGEAELLIRELQHNPDAHQRLQRILDAIERSKSIGLGLAKLGAATTSNALSFVEPAIDHALTRITSHIDRQSIILETNININGVQIALSHDEIQHVIFNVVLNAIHAVTTKTQGIVSITAKVSKAQCMIIITDNGMGIPSTDLHRLADPFFSRKHGGTEIPTYPHGITGVGLGLTVTKTLTERAGGTLDITSSPAGTTVTLTIPATMATQVSVPLQTRQVVSSGPKRILVVDDNESLLEIISETLKYAGYEVHGYTQGKKALAYHQHYQADFIISDLHMPIMSGEEFLAHINLHQDQHHLPNVPVIITTGDPALVTIPGASLTIVETLIKPFHMGQLVDQVRSYFQAVGTKTTQS